jgi:hypothetical protein
MIGDDILALLHRIAASSRYLDDYDRNALLRQLSRLRSIIIQQQHDTPPRIPQKTRRLAAE